MKKFALLLAVTTTTAVLGMACAGGGDDDDDGATSPTPTATTTTVPITGTLTTAYGMISGGMDSASPTPGTGFSLESTLGGEAVNSPTANEEWSCYAPDPPDFPNYDIISSDGATYQLIASFDTGAWTVGDHTIDGLETGVYVAVGGADRFGEATSGGTITLTAAPTTNGDPCGFNTGNVPLEGEAAAFAPIQLNLERGRRF